MTTWEPATPPEPELKPAPLPYRAERGEAERIIRQFLESGEETCLVRNGTNDARRVQSRFNVCAKRKQLPVTANVRGGEVYLTRGEEPPDAD